MRDHLTQLQAPRAFVTWRERHQVRFEFQSSEGGAGGGGSTGASRRFVRLALLQPSAFSTRAQANAQGTVFHFPLARSAAGGAADQWLAAWDTRAVQPPQGGRLQ
jgi:hypothetical protein